MTDDLDRKGEVRAIVICLGMILLSEPFWALWQVQSRLGAALVSACVGISLCRQGIRWLGGIGGTVAGLLGAALLRDSGGLPCLMGIAGGLGLLRERSQHRFLNASLMAVCLWSFACGLASTAWGGRMLVAMDEFARSATRASLGVGLSGSQLGFGSSLAILSGACVESAQSRRAWIRPAALTLSLAVAVPIGGAYVLKTATASWLMSIAVAPFVSSIFVIASTRFAWDWTHASSEPARRLCWLGMLLASCFAGLWCAESIWMSLTRPQASDIAVLKVGYQDWDRPTHGRYGLWSGGMFGCLSDYAALHDASLRGIDRPALRQLTAGEGRFLFIINLNTSLSDAELEAIHQFMVGGGTCIVLGDHTDVAGVMGGTNALTGRYGIEIKFDAAKNIGSERMILVRDTVGWLRWIRKPDFLPYSVGASLRIQDSAFPLCSMRNGLSDRGVRTNVLGAFLGNYAIDREEDVGDLVVIAGARVGAGGLVVFGDTTPFQNGCLPWTAGGGFLGGLLRWYREPPWVRLFGLTLVPVVLLGLTIFGRRVAFVGSAVVSFAWIGISPVVVEEQALSDSRASVARPVCAWIEEQPVDRAPSEPRWKSTWSVMRSLERAGFTVVHYSRLTEGLLRKSDLVAICLPVKTISEQQDLLNYIEAGGQFVFVGGPRHAAALKLLWERCGLRIDPYALGEVPKGGRRNGVEQPWFPSGYNIHVERELEQRVTVLFGQGPIRCAVRLQYGNGAITVVADDYLPYGDCLEGVDTWHIGNIMFVERVWRRVLADRSEGGS